MKKSKAEIIRELEETIEQSKIQSKITNALVKVSLNNFFQSIEKKLISIE
jgi:hypothetical protein